MKKKFVTVISMLMTCFFWQANSQSKPVIKCSENMNVQTNVGQRTATVNFLYSAALDPDNGAKVPVKQTKGLVSGSQFPIGKTIIEFTARDEDGVTTCQFTVNVTDK
jgi:hypothetical protein